MLVRDLMTRDPAITTTGDSVVEAAEQMRTRGVGMLPVVDQVVHRQLEGVITDRDIVVRFVALGHGPRAKVHEHMTRTALVSVVPTHTLEYAAELMRANHLRRLPVLDEAGCVVGVITLTDLARHWAEEAPELAGELIAHVSEPGALVPGSA